MNLDVLAKSVLPVVDLFVPPNERLVARFLERDVAVDGNLPIVHATLDAGDGQVVMARDAAGSSYAVPIGASNREQSNPWILLHVGILSRLA